MGREIFYQIKNPTNQLFKTAYSTLSNQVKINPWFITGFSDAESSFSISINRNLKSRLSWRVSVCFEIHIHINNIQILKNIRDTLGVGKVRQDSPTTAMYSVENFKDLQVIIDHFNKYPLIGVKLCDFLIFKQCYYLMQQKLHLTQIGLEKIIALKCNHNEGLSDELSQAFPNIVPVPRPDYHFNGIPNPFWIAGVLRPPSLSGGFMFLCFN